MRIKDLDSRFFVLSLLSNPAFVTFQFGILNFKVCFFVVAGSICQEGFLTKKLMCLKYLAKYLFGFVLAYALSVSLSQWKYLFHYSEFRLFVHFLWNFTSWTWGSIMHNWLYFLNLNSMAWSIPGLLWWTHNKPSKILSNQMVDVLFIYFFIFWHNQIVDFHRDSVEALEQGVYWSCIVVLTHVHHLFFFLPKLFLVFSFIYGHLSVWCLFPRQLLLCLYKKLSRHKFLPQLFLHYNLLKLQLWTVDKHIHMGLVDNHIHMDLTYVFISITDNLSFQQIVRESLW